MTLYLDVLIVVNFLADYLLLRITAKVMAHPLKRLRFVLTAAAGALSSSRRHAGRRDVPARAGYALLRRVLHARQSCRQPDAAQRRDVRAEHARAVRDDAAGVMNFTEALLFSGFAHTMLCAYQL